MWNLDIYAYHWMRHIRFRVKILAAFGTESDCAILVTTDLQEEVNIIYWGMLKISASL